MGMGCNPPPPPNCPIQYSNTACTILPCHVLNFIMEKGVGNLPPPKHTHKTKTAPRKVLKYSLLHSCLSWLIPAGQFVNSVYLWNHDVWQMTDSEGHTNDAMNEDDVREVTEKFCTGRNQGSLVQILQTLPRDKRQQQSKICCPNWANEIKLLQGIYIFNISRAF